MAQATKEKRREEEKRHESEQQAAREYDFWESEQNLTHVGA